jgi:hypothetical protein
VFDGSREIWGLEAISKYTTEEFVDDRVTMEVRELVDHYGDVIVRAKWTATTTRRTMSFVVAFE